MCAGDGDVVDFEGAAESAFIVGFGFGEIGEGAEFGALRGDQVALSENDVVDGGGAKFVLLIFRVEGLLLKFARFAGGLDLSAALLDSDGGVANIEESIVLGLLDFGFELALDELRVNVIGLRGAIAQRKREGELAGIDREIIVKDLSLGSAEAAVNEASRGRNEFRNV